MTDNAQIMTQSSVMNTQTTDNDDNVETDASRTYMIKPTVTNRFKSEVVKELIHNILVENLSGKEYSTTLAETWTKTIADSIRDKVKELNFTRYKIIVQVFLGENRGAGVKSGSRCLWDSESDRFSTDSYVNETIFCSATVYGVYFY